MARRKTKKLSSTLMQTSTANHSISFADVKSIVSVSHGGKEVIQIAKGSVVLWKKNRAPADAFYFKAENAGAKLWIERKGDLDEFVKGISLMSSDNGTDWSEVVLSAGALSSAENAYVFNSAGDCLYLKAKEDQPNSRWCQYLNSGNPSSWVESRFLRFNATGGRIGAYGNIQYLLESTGSQMTVGQAAFAFLFAAQDSLPNEWLVHAPEFPATTLTSDVDANAIHQYDSTFLNCTALSTGPLVLPAQDVALGSYTGMFKGCTSLTAAPTLSALTYGQSSCREMFLSCSSLSTAPSLYRSQDPAAITLGDYCYYCMFESCSSLTSLPTLPCSSIPMYGYYAMHRKCSNLTQPPVLPATTVHQFSYAYMFDQCSSLSVLSANDHPELTTISWSLPANLTFVSKWNYRMFNSTALTEVIEPVPGTTYYVVQRAS